MPIYDYVCSACGHRLEVIHGVSEAGPHFCSACGAEGTMKKVFVPPAIHFKGSGWAKKDRSSASSSTKSAGSKRSPAKDASTDGASDPGTGGSSSGATAKASGGTNGPTGAGGSGEGT
jgi:putative FmdB family regulatory protein